MPKDIIPPGPPFPMELIIFLLSQRPRRIKIAIGSTYPRIRDKKQGLSLRCSTLYTYARIVKMGYKILILYRYRLTIDIISIYLHRIIDIIRINSCFIYFSSVYSFQEGGVIGLFYTSLRKSRKSKTFSKTIITTAIM